jgi:tetratricopeptide (TPR) repeat protein
LLSNISTNVFQFEINDFLFKQWIYKTIFLLLCGICMHQIISSTNKLSQGFIAWNNALISHQYGNYESAIIDYELTYPIFEKDGDFLMNYGKTLSMAEKPHKAIAVLEQAKHYQNNTIIATALGDSYKAIKQYDKAEVAYQQAINMTPGKFYANYLLAKLYDVSGQKVKAVSMAKKLLNKEIKITSTAIEEIHEEMKKILIKYKNPLGF